MASSTACAELIQRCFDARTMAHQHHLKTTSFAQHKALEDFYSEIVDLADSFAEAYQGQYGLITSYPASTAKPFGTPVAMLKDFVGWVSTNRAKCCDETHLQNIIDEIVALAYSTLYKLENLK